MFGNNTTHLENIIYTNHSTYRLTQREISRRAIEYARKYGTETIQNGARKVTIDFKACNAAEEDGVDLIPFYSTTIVISPDNVLKTVYVKEIDN